VSLDRQLIDTIKEHLARQPSAELRSMMEANDRARWSDEAFAAADEVLSDRAAGRAREPAAPAPEPPPPPPKAPAFDDLALIVGLNLLTIPLGFVIHPGLRGGPVDTVARDRPVPFGQRTAWLAVSTRDTAAVVAALDVGEPREATWADGIDAAYRSAVFVTPPLGDWTLCVSTRLIPPGQAAAFIRPLLERLSREFDDAQYFCTHRDVELHMWARAQQGRFVRGYGWLGQRGLTLWDEGPPTQDECDLEFRFGDDSHPDEVCVLQLASLWSLDPTSLGMHFKEPVLGVLGTAPWGSQAAQ
jgi:hypothetical protein